MQGMRPHPLANFLDKFGQNLGQFEKTRADLSKIWTNWVNLVKFD